MSRFGHLEPHTPGHARRRLALRGLVMASLVLSARPSSAQSDEELQRAREQFRHAIALQSAGDCDAALKEFRAVARVKMTPHVQFNIALCEERLGQLVAAMGDYRLALADAEEAGIDEVATPAREALATLAERIPRLTIRRGRNAGSVTVLLDGTKLGEAALGESAPRDPGGYIVTATLEGREVFREQVQLGEGATAEVVVDVPDEAVAGPAGRSVGPDTGPTRQAAGDRDASSARLRTAGWVVGGVGLAALAAGGAFIGLRQKTIDDLEGQCDGRTCPQSARSTIDRGKLYTGLAEGSVLVGVAGVVTGAVLLVTSRSDGGEAPPPRANVGLSAGKHGTAAVVFGSF